MAILAPGTIIAALIFLAILAFSIFMTVLIVKALLKYLRSGEVRREKTVFRGSLGEVLRARRESCKMTQEFVAEKIGVSRQAVSKWENGTADPSTANLFALAKLYDTTVEELLRGIKAE